MTAQIKLKHSGGNGVIIEAPASNPASDKTITLPSDETGVFTTKDSANNLQNVSGINSGQLGNRRLNINGAMLVNQRGNETGVNSNVYSACDRYNIYVNKGTYTVSQSTNAPNGFSKSLKLACTSAESLGADGFVAITYRMEGLDCTPFQAGTPDAKPITLSFWIRSNLTGQFQVNFENENNAHSSGADGINSRAVSISSANTWEKKVVTMPGDTAVALDTTTTAKQFCFDIFLSAGTNYTNNGTLKQTWQGLDNNDRGAACTGFNLASSTNNFVEITGVQLEIGNQPTEFEHRSFSQELALCQRYFHKWKASDAAGTAYMNVSSGYGGGTTFMEAMYQLPVTMRAAPSFSTSGNWRFVIPGNAMVGSNLVLNRSHPKTAYLRGSVSGGTNGLSGEFGANNDTSFQISFSAEI